MKKCLLALPLLVMGCAELKPIALDAAQAALTVAVPKIKDLVEDRTATKCAKGGSVIVAILCDSADM